MVSIMGIPLLAGLRAPERLHGAPSQMNKATTLSHATKIRSKTPVPRSGLPGTIDRMIGPHDVTLEIHLCWPSWCPAWCGTARSQMRDSRDHHGVLGTIMDLRVCAGCCELWTAHVVAGLPQMRALTGVCMGCSRVRADASRHHKRLGAITHLPHPTTIRLLRRRNNRFRKSFRTCDVNCGAFAGRVQWFLLAARRPSTSRCRSAGIVTARLGGTLLRHAVGVGLIQPGKHHKLLRVRFGVKKCLFSGPSYVRMPCSAIISTSWASSLDMACLQRLVPARSEDCKLREKGISEVYACGPR